MMELYSKVNAWVGMGWEKEKENLPLPCWSPSEINAPAQISSSKLIDSADRVHRIERKRERNRRQ